MPALPGFGAQPIPATMEPAPLAGNGPAQAPPASAAQAQGERPAFFVQWKPNMPGVTRKPMVEASTPLPEYPREAVRGGDEGTTTLESCVTLDGRLVDVKLARSSGSPALDNATLTWARQAKFLPAEFNGQPMAICGYRLDHEWRVDEE